MNIDLERKLKLHLKFAYATELGKNYKERNLHVIHALATALSLGLNAGIRFDNEDPDWPVIFISLPTGQVSWHVEDYALEWDGHDTVQKWNRVWEYVGE